MSAVQTLDLTFFQGVFFSCLKAVYSRSHTMVNRCCVGGCSCTYADGVSLFKFPQDDLLFNEWVKQVRRTRVKWAGPDKYSLVCSKHFTEDCFDNTRLLRQQCGWKLQRLRVLNSTAVPTIFFKPKHGLLGKKSPSKAQAYSCVLRCEWFAIAWYTL